jgi:hypothetical protein
MIIDNELLKNKSFITYRNMQIDTNIGSYFTDSLIKSYNYLNLINNKENSFIQINPFNLKDYIKLTDRIEILYSGNNTPLCKIYYSNNYFDFNEIVFDSETDIITTDGKITFKLNIDYKIKNLKFEFLNSDYTILNINCFEKDISINSDEYIKLFKKYKYKEISKEDNPFKKTKLGNLLNNYI